MTLTLAPTASAAAVATAAAVLRPPLLLLATTRPWSLRIQCAYFFIARLPPLCSFLTLALLARVELLHIRL